MEDKAVLISIHPEYVEKILSGEKRMEFRRCWTSTPVKFMVIYATLPIKKIVAVAEIKEVYNGSRDNLWGLAKEKGGGVSRRKLYSYFKGSKRPVAIELTNVRRLKIDLDPKSILGDSFRPPQSYIYLNDEYFNRIIDLS